jgi:hypothetical protein
MVSEGYDGVDGPWNLSNAVQVNEPENLIWTRVSSNDIYKDKRDDYAKSDIIWNELLSGYLSSVDAHVLPDAFQDAAISADQQGAFPRDKVEQRQRLFFEAFKTIWAEG